MRSPPIDLNTLSTELHKIAQAKTKLEDFAVKRNELLAELADFQQSKKFIEETQKTISDLNEEKDAHSEIIQQINMDKQELEKMMNSAKEEKRQMEESISQKYEEIFRLLEQTNELSRESGVAEEDLISPSIIPPNKITPNIPGIGPLQAVSTGVPALLHHFKMNSMPAVVQRAMFNFDSMLLQAAAGTSTMTRPQTIPPHSFPTSSNLVKVDHQSPPMKTCQSCFQQIHRNAPICPMCKTQELELESMDVSSLSKELFKLSAANQKLNEFTERLNDLRIALNEFREICIFISKCEQLRADLEGERRSHAEELRQINQDINHLEDAFKSLKNGNSAKRDRIAKKYQEVERELDLTNEVLCESGIPETDLLTNEILLPSQFDEVIENNAANHLALMTPMLLNHISHLSFLDLLNPHFLEISERFAGTSSAGGAAIRNMASTINEPAKMKVKCQYCEHLIHRNAPVCPRCKSKSRSRCHRRSRKMGP
ncbi:unnamed protein product [Thelazia callipaeda]|uniref:C4H2-type domain-containing protein n=1 Tax=Thelazia callipaeda TaxID=103827 RepID=A0A158RAP2_THECL|nr:unnamed protein product [Thelazia callipaeda]